MNSYIFKISLFICIFIAPKATMASTCNAHHCLTNYLTEINKKRMSNVGNSTDSPNSETKKTFNKDGKRICNLDGCGKIYSGKGYCQTHYLRFKKHGGPLLGKKTVPRNSFKETFNSKGDRICNLESCDNAYKSNNYCSKHLKRQLTHGDPHMVIKKERSQEGRIWLESNKDYNGDDCLVFPFFKSKAGYGRFYLGDKHTYAHRYMCELKNEKTTRARNVCRHLCGNGHKGCVNPLHLKWGTAKENGEDTVMHGKSTRGERNPMSKLKNNQVLEIVKLSKTKTRKEIARIHKIKISLVNDILRGCLWSWLTGIKHVKTKKARLSKFQVLQIVELSKTHTRVEISSKTGAKRGVVESVLRGDTYSKLTGIKVKKKEYVKLTPVQVLAIVKLQGTMIQRDIAKIYCISQTTVSGILKGRRHSKITGIK